LRFGPPICIPDDEIDLVKRVVKTLDTVSAL
jgi:hypothetical protein